MRLPPASRLILPALVAPLLAGLAGGLAGCATVPAPPFVALAAVDATSVAVLGRDMGDVVVSAVTGRDCSVVRLDRGKTYCRVEEPRPPRPPYCTRSLGVVDCWKNPEALVGSARQMADGPIELTQEQEARRTRRWP